jgi:hypothetical protein
VRLYDSEEIFVGEGQRTAKRDTEQLVKASQAGVCIRNRLGRAIETHIDNRRSFGLARRQEARYESADRRT